MIACRMEAISCWSKRQALGRFVDQRLEQKNNQQMGEDMRPGGTLVGCRRALQTDQALQPLEAQFDAPSQTIKSEDISGGEVVRLK
jgi:hypothetical protein